MGQPAQGGLLLRTKDYDVTIKTEDVRGVQLAKEYMEESREAEVL
jgi:hypothetical protein